MVTKANKNINLSGEDDEMYPEVEMMIEQKAYESFLFAAEYLGVSTHAMQILCFNRKIRYYRPNGKQSYFDVADLDAYIMGGEVIEPSDKDKIVRGGRFNSKKQKS